MITKVEENEKLSDTLDNSRVKCQLYSWGLGVVSIEVSDFKVDDSND